MLRILVTGHLGLIGSRLIPLLDEHEVIGLDRIDGNDILTCDLPDVDLVYHLAARTNVVDSMKDPLSDARDNVLGTVRIAEHYKNTKVIYTASAASIDPQSPYGISKLAGEYYIKTTVPNYVILRFPNIFDKDAKQGLIPAVLNNDTVKVYGDGSQMRDYVHASDAAKGLLLAKDWECGEYALSSGRGTSTGDIARATGKPIEWLPARTGEKQESLLELRAPGWLPTIDVIEYVRRYSHTRV